MSGNLHPLTKTVADFYTELDSKCNFKTRVNASDLPPRINQIIGQLSEETMKRYYGSGFIVPENVKGCRILDIGCGSGSLVFILSKLVGPTGYVVGVDVTKALIETATGQIDYHVKAWGYDKPNFEFKHGNVDRLLEMGLGEFDTIVSNGVFCLLPDKEKAYQAVAKLLKPGGQFYISDVYTTFDQPEENKKNEKLWSLGTSGSMIWSDVKNVAGKAGFTTPYLTQSASVDIKNDEYKKMLNNAEYVCAAWRLFKLPPGASRGAATVTYKGNIEDYEESFTWDINTTFKKGEAVNVDAELATILANTNFKNNFDFKDFSGAVTTSRNQNPFQYLTDLAKQGQVPEPIYAVE